MLLNDCSNVYIYCCRAKYLKTDSATLLSVEKPYKCGVISFLFKMKTSFPNKVNEDLFKIVLNAQIKSQINFVMDDLNEMVIMLSVLKATSVHFFHKFRYKKCICNIDISE